MRSIDIDALVGSGRLPLALRPRLARALVSLEAAGLAEENNGRWQVIGDPLMPGTASVVRELRAKHPDRAAELFITGAIAGLAEKIASSRAVTGSAQIDPVRERARFLRRRLGVATGESSAILERLLGR